MPPRMRKAPKPKQPSYERIERDNDPLGVYDVLDEMVREKRPELKEARIGLAWRYGLKRNKDGHLVLGKCKKVSDLDKQFAGYDIIVILNREAWQTLDEDQRRALMFHELCHAALSEDQNGNPKKDARGRQIYRIRKHDIEEFGEVVVQFGCYKLDLENFVRSAMNSKKPPRPTLFDEPEAEANSDKEKESEIVEPSANGHHLAEPSANGHAGARIASRTPRRPAPKSRAKAGKGRGR